MSLQKEIVIDLKNPGPPQNSDWLLLFYIVGDSMLSASMISQLKELTDAGFQENATVLAYFDPNANGRSARMFNVNEVRKQNRKLHGKPPTIIGDGRDPYAHNIAEDGHVRGLPQRTAADSLSYFLKVATIAFRAKNYMLFLMGHGTIVGNDAYLPDPDDHSAITLAQLGTILKTFAADVRGTEKKSAATDSELSKPSEFDHGQFHLVGFHSCAMNSVELAYELQGTARYLVGTQGMAFPDSWPYRQLLKKIYCKIEKYEKDASLGTAPGPNILVEHILRGIQDLSFYNGEDFWQAGYSSDISMFSLDSDKVKLLDIPLRELVQALKTGLDNGTARDGIVLAHWESQSYWNESYTDLFDFCDRLEVYCKSETAITDACKKIKDTLSEKPHEFDNLIVFSDYYGPHYQFSHGLSVYLPWASPGERVMKNYDQYAFTKAFIEGEKIDNSWASFLKAYWKGTMRRMRGGDQKPLQGDNKEAAKIAEPAADKPPGLDSPGPPPDKPPAFGSSGSPSTLPALGPPPDKPPAWGSFGATIIKNYFDDDDVFITSRPKHDSDQTEKRDQKLINESDAERDDDEDQPL